MPREFGNFYFNSRGMSFWGGSRLGVSVESLTEQLGNYFGVKEGQGVLVTEVQTDSAAAKAGLKAGDIIIEIDNEKIKSTSDLASAVAKKEEGQMVLKVLRNRDEKTFTVTLEKREIRPATRKRAVIYSPVTDVI
jgi:S1-C subfamily serine protease